MTDKLTHILEHAYANAPAVRTIFDQAGLKPGDVRSASELDKIPVTSKDRLVEMQQANPPFGGFLAVPIEKLQHIFFSPGPLYEPHAGESAVMDTIREMFGIAGFAPGDVVINTFGYHLIPTGLALDQTFREMGATVIPAGVGNAELQVKMMLDLKVSGYVGTPSWLMALIQKAEESGLDFRKAFALKKTLLSAEPLPLLCCSLLASVQSACFLVQTPLPMSRLARHAALPRRIFQCFVPGTTRRSVPIPQASPASLVQ